MVSLILKFVFPNKSDRIARGKQGNSSRIYHECGRGVNKVKSLNLPRLMLEIDGVGELRKSGTCLPSRITLNLGFSSEAVVSCA